MALPGFPFKRSPWLHCIAWIAGTRVVEVDLAGVLYGCRQEMKILVEISAMKMERGMQFGKILRSKTEGIWYRTGNAEGTGVRMAPELLASTLKVGFCSVSWVGLQ